MDPLAPHDPQGDPRYRTAYWARLAMGEAENYFSCEIRDVSDWFILSIHRVGGRPVSDRIRELEREVGRLREQVEERYGPHPPQLRRQQEPPDPCAPFVRKAQAAALEWVLERGAFRVGFEDPETGVEYEVTVESIDLDNETNHERLSHLEEEARTLRDLLALTP